jgi:SAM-dependent methyltransferase
MFKKLIIWLSRAAIAPAVRRILPLSLRERVVECWRRAGLANHFFLTMMLLGDFAQEDAMGFHRYLWTHHLAYAESYEPSRFDDDKIVQPILMLFDEIELRLRSHGLSPERDVHSVFEFGCSLGYVLRHAEGRFPSADRLHGIDVDQYAIEKGTTYLRELGSKVDISVGDDTNLESILGKQKYDIVLCSGVLPYFNQIKAQTIVNTLLSHTNLILGIISLGHPLHNNSELIESDVRPLDNSFIHNVNSFIKVAGGRLVYHQWMGDQVFTGISSPDLVLAEPHSMIELISDLPAGGEF